MQASIIAGTGPAMYEVSSARVEGIGGVSGEAPGRSLRLDARHVTALRPELAEDFVKIHQRTLA
jgi:hypothetical protein